MCTFYIFCKVINKLYSENPLNFLIGVQKNTSVKVSAKITSNVNITRMGLEYMKFYPHGSGGGSGGTSGSKNDTFEGEINLEGFDGEGHEKGTRVFFRVIAQDETGNTAVSQTHSFTIL